MGDKRSLGFAFLGEDKGLGRVLKGVAKDSDHAHSSLSRLGKVAIGAGAIAGVALLSKKVIDLGKDTVGAYTGAAKSAGALQRILGGSVEDASRLGFAAHEAGVSQESFGKSVRLLEKNLGSATKAQVIKTKATHQEIVTVNRLKDGHIVHVKALKNVTDWTSRTVKVSKDLGFTYKDAHGKMLPMRDILLNVADKFQHMPNGVEKTALALKLFGRAGTDMIPMLNKGREGVVELMKESDKLGTTMSSKDVKAVKEYTLQQRHLHSAMDGLKITLGRELFPIFTAWSDSLAKNAPKIIAWVKDHLPGFRREAQKVASFIKHDLAPAVTDFTDGLIEEGGQIAKDVAPFFHWLGEHPDLLKQIGKDALILGGALKAKSFLTGLGLLKGAGGARLGAGLVGSAATRAAPVPVFVTNAGGLPGGKGAGAAGSAAAGAAGGGAVGTVEKVGAGALARRALAGPLGGVGSVLLTSGDEAIGDSGKQRRALGAQIEKLIGAKTARSVPSDLWSSAVGTAGKFGDSWKTKPNALAQYQILSQYGKGSDPALLAAMARLAASQAVRDYNADNDPQRAQRGQTRAMTLAAARTPAERLERITNNYYVTVNGLTLDQALAQAHRKARVHALGATNTPASRDLG